LEFNRSINFIYIVILVSTKKGSSDLIDHFKIINEELIGNGTFGHVYKGISFSKQEVAIKVIDKSILDDDSKLKNDTRQFLLEESELLSSIDHNGIIKTIGIFNEKDHIFIITEKLKMDLLEKIMSNDPTRLSENCTKFIIYQVDFAMFLINCKNC
jgi:serine/threonine protein kinase